MCTDWYWNKWKLRGEETPNSKVKGGRKKSAYKEKRPISNGFEATVRLTLLGIKHFNNYLETFYYFR